jgi:hypothetical protein
MPSKSHNHTRKDSLVTRSVTKPSDNLELSNKVSQASLTSSKKSSSISRSTERPVKSVSEDSGPKRGNKATVVPKRPSPPDVNAFLQHIATHDRHRSSSLGSPSSRSTRLGDSSPRRPFNSQYAARSHSDMIPRAFQRWRPKEGDESNPRGRITQAVWQEFERQQKLNQTKSLLGVEGTDARNGVVGSQAVLQQALRDREGGYRHGVNS